MWSIFKLLNLSFILVSAYIWVTALLPIGPVLLVLNIALILCFGFLPFGFTFDKRTGFIILTLLALVLWTIYNENISMGMTMLCMYSPVLYIIPLPREYQADLLHFVVKWMAIMLIPSLLIYWVNLFINLPGFGMYVYPHYEPYVNYLFYLKSTYDTGLFERFNAFYLEPGHLAMSCEFFMFAYKYDFKRNPWMWVLLVALVFSFSLAGYLLTFAGFALTKVNNLGRSLLLAAVLAGGVIAIQNYSGGDNAVNQLILDRLKYDQDKGIQGNNRFFNNTDFEYDKAIESGDYWTGVSGKANMELIGGSGFKIYILKHGLIGVFLVLAFYLSIIPSRPDWHFTLSFLFIFILCFLQNAYPGWYSWLLPYVLGLDLYRKRGPSDGEQYSYLAAGTYN